MAYELEDHSLAQNSINRASFDVSRSQMAGKTYNEALTTILNAGMIYPDLFVHFLTVAGLQIPSKAEAIEDERQRVSNLIKESNFDPETVFIKVVPGYGDALIAYMYAAEAGIYPTDESDDHGI